MKGIGHFQVPLCLCFKVSLSAKPFLSKMTFICLKMKLHAELIFIWKVLSRLVLKQRHKSTRKWLITRRLIHFETEYIQINSEMKYRLQSD